MPRELGVPRVACEQGAGRRLHARDDPVGAGAAGHAEDPFDVGGHGQPPGTARAVLDRQGRDLEVVVQRDELDQVETDPVMVVLEAAVPPPVVNDVRRLLHANRLRARAPDLAGFVVANVDRLADRIPDRVVRPRRDLVLAAVAGPGVAAARFGHEEPELGIGDHVRPRRGRRLAGTEDDDVLAPVIGEPAEAVEELQVGRHRRRRLGLAGAAGDPGRGLPGSGTIDADHLVREGPAPADDDDSRDRLDERPVLGRELLGREQVDAALAGGTVVDEP